MCFSWPMKVFLKRKKKKRKEKRNNNKEPQKTWSSRSKAPQAVSANEPRGLAQPCISIHKPKPEPTHAPPPRRPPPEHHQELRSSESSGKRKLHLAGSSTFAPKKGTAFSRVRNGRGRGGGRKKGRLLGFGRGWECGEETTGECCWRARRRRRGFGVFGNFETLEGRGPAGVDRTGHEEIDVPTPSSSFHQNLEEGCKCKQLIN